MRKLFLLFIIILQTTSWGAPKNASTLPVLQKNRAILFHNTLAYLPSILMSHLATLPRSAEEFFVMQEILNLTAENLDLKYKADFANPAHYNFFRIQESSDPRLFNLHPGEPPRTASTNGDKRSPIYVNAKIINDPSQDFSLPQIVQILIHELGRKTPQDRIAHMSEQQIEAYMSVVDQVGARLARALTADTTVLEISPTEKLHILKTPVPFELPKIGMNPYEKDYDKAITMFKGHFLRSGREVLIYYENEKEFIYVPSLQPALNEENHNTRHPKQRQAMSLSSNFLEEVRIDRSVGRRPVVRFRLHIQERVYRLTKKTYKNAQGEEVPTGETGLQSLSSTDNEQIKTSPEDEMMDSRWEIAIRFHKNGNVETTRRRVTLTDPQIQILDFKSVDAGDHIRGNFKVNFPDSLRAEFLNWNLRASMLARMENGLVRIEVQRMKIEKDFAEIEFRLPKSQDITQGFAVEEVVLKTPTQEVVADLPESIVVKKAELKPQGMDLVKVSLLQNETWKNLGYKKFRGKEENLSGYEHFSPENLSSVVVDPGVQKLQLAIRSDSPLHEIYFYIRKVYTTHDPMIRHALDTTFKGFGFIGEALKAQPQIVSQSISFFQVLDEVVHFSASEMKQTRTGPFVIVEVDLPLAAPQDRGAFTYDTGTRSLGKVIAVNQKLERLRLLDLRHPMFSLRGAFNGLRSCKEVVK